MIATSTFTFADTLSVHSFQYGSYTIWKRRSSEDRSPIDFKTPEQIAMFKVAGERIHTLPLSAPHFDLLSTLSKSVTLEDSIESVSERHELSEDIIRGFFALLVQNQLIADIKS